jgi:hypothetical protein
VSPAGASVHGLGLDRPLGNFMQLQHFGACARSAVDLELLEAVRDDTCEPASMVAGYGCPSGRTN